SAGRLDDDSAFELKLRPSRLAEFIGQEKAKEQLSIALEAAKSRGEAMDHVLLFGPPGLGKTTLATIIANELGVGFQPTSGSPLRSRFGILLRLEFYTDDELRFVVERSAEVLGVPIDRDGAAEIAMRSRGTPRIANRLLRRVRDYAQVRAGGVIDRATAQAAL